MELIIDGAQIRGFCDADIDGLCRSFGDPKVTRMLREIPSPYTRTHAREWVEVTRDERPLRHFAIAKDCELIGGVGFKFQAGVYSHTAEIGYWLNEPYWGQGIATEVVRTMTAYAFDHFDLVRVFAQVFESNPASARVLEKVGYQLDGRLRKNVDKDGRLLDELVYSRLCDE